MSRKILALIVTAVVVVAVACTPNAKEDDARAMNASLNTLRAAQPTPKFAWSQLRQTLIDAETVAANGTQTTSFFFTRGAGGQGAPVNVCPSLGFPVAGTSQLTAPNDIDPTGVYAGDTDATYVLCVSTAGKPYLVHSEADVITVGGPAEWKDGRIVLIGEPSLAPGTKPK